MNVPFSKKFNYAPYLNVDIGAEGTCEETKESFFNELDKLNDWCNEWFRTRYGEFDEQVGMIEKIITPAPKEPEKEVSIVDAINSCTELKVLESYKFIAKTKPEYQTAYDNKFGKLMAKHLTD